MSRSGKFRAVNMILPLESHLAPNVRPPLPRKKVLESKQAVKTDVSAESNAGDIALSLMTEARNSPTSLTIHAQ